MWSKRKHLSKMVISTFRTLPVRYCDGSLYINVVRIARTASSEAMYLLHDPTALPGNVPSLYSLQSAYGIQELPKELSREILGARGVGDLEARTRRCHPSSYLPELHGGGMTSRPHG